MKRLATALLITTALSTAAWAETPTERERNSFDYVAQAHVAEQAPAPVTEYGQGRGYNKAVDEHNKHMHHGHHHHGHHDKHEKGEKGEHHHHHHHMHGKKEEKANPAAAQ